MEEHGIEQDHRVSKSCFSYAFYYCRHAEACMAGETELLYIPRQEIRELVSEEAAYIFDFDGSSIEAPNQSGGSSFDPPVTSPTDASAFTSRVRLRRSWQ